MLLCLAWAVARTSAVSVVMAVACATAQATPDDPRFRLPSRSEVEGLAIDFQRPLFLVYESTDKREVFWLDLAGRSFYRLQPAFEAMPRDMRLFPYSGNAQADEIDHPFLTDDLTAETAGKLRLVGFEFRTVHENYSVVQRRLIRRRVAMRSSRDRSPAGELDVLYLETPVGALQLDDVPSSFWGLLQRPDVATPPVRCEPLRMAAVPTAPPCLEPEPVPVPVPVPVWWSWSSLWVGLVAGCGVWRPWRNRRVWQVRVAGGKGPA